MQWEVSLFDKYDSRCDVALTPVICMKDLHNQKVSDIRYFMQTSCLESSKITSCVQASRGYIIHFSVWIQSTSGVSTDEKICKLSVALPIV